LGGYYKLFTFGLPSHGFEIMLVFTFPITVLAMLANVTAILRLQQPKKALENRASPAKQPSLV